MKFCSRNWNWFPKIEDMKVQTQLNSSFQFDPSTLVESNILLKQLNNTSLMKIKLICGDLHILVKLDVCFCSWLIQHFHLQSLSKDFYLSKCFLDRIIHTICCRFEESSKRYRQLLFKHEYEYDLPCICSNLLDYSNNHDQT